MTTAALSLWISLLTCITVMALVWRVQQQTRNAGWVDVAWAGLLGAQALFYAVVAQPRTTAAWSGLALAIFWSVRLCLHLARRVAGESEDGRYQALRNHWQGHEHSRFFWFFQAQAALAWLLGLVFFQLSFYPATFAWPALLGLTLGVTAILCEAQADRQLARHRQRFPGITCRSGWWRYSRHPNYFFEWLHWWAYPILAWGTTGAGYLWLAPAMMLLFLYRLTGIPYTERQALKSRGDDYRRYQRETSAFIPWPKRRVEESSPLV